MRGIATIILSWVLCLPKFLTAAILRIKITFKKNKAVGLFALEILKSLLLRKCLRTQYAS